MIKRIKKSHDNNLNKPKINGPKKFTAVLKLSYISETLRVFRSRIKKLTKTLYNIVHQRIVFFRNQK